MVELKERDIKTLISLVTEELNRVGRARENRGFRDPAYFYHLLDMRNRLLTLPPDEELPSTINDEDWQELLRGKSA